MSAYAPGQRRACRRPRPLVRGRPGERDDNGDDLSELALGGGAPRPVDAHARPLPGVGRRAGVPQVRQSGALPARGPGRMGEDPPAQVHLGRRQRRGPRRRSSRRKRPESDRAASGWRQGLERDAPAVPMKARPLTRSDRSTRRRITTIKQSANPTIKCRAHAQAAVAAAAVQLLASALAAAWPR